MIEAIRKSRVFLFCAIMFLGLFQGCSTIPEYEGIRTVAVWDLENLSPGASAAPNLGQVLSGEIIQAIKQSGDIQVVEREKLVAILEELKLGSSELADESTRLKVGRMIGAREMVFGGYMVVGGTMRLDLRRVDVETGKVVKTAKKIDGANDIGAWIKSAQDAAAILYGK
jgi:hypothetical protein